MRRAKGNKFMQLIAKRLREEAFPGLEIHKGDQGRKGSDAADVDAPGLPIWPECKHAGTIGKANPFKAIIQAEEVSDGRPPVAFCRVGSKTGERYAPIMAVPLGFGLELLRAWRHCREHAPQALLPPLLLPACPAPATPSDGAASAPPLPPLPPETP